MWNQLGGRVDGPDGGESRDGSGPRMPDGGERLAGGTSLGWRGWLCVGKRGVKGQESFIVDGEWLDQGVRKRV